MLVDACNALTHACDQRVEGVQLIIEQGIVGRLCEMCESNHANIREIAVLVLCAVLRSPDPMHRRVVLCRRYSGALRSIIAELTTSSSDKHRAEIAGTIRRLLEREIKYLTPCLNLNLLDQLCFIIDKGVFDVNVQAGHCLCLVILGCSPEIMPGIAIQVKCLTKFSSCLHRFILSEEYHTVRIIRAPHYERNLEAFNQCFMFLL
jgi:hypothetical protein